MSEWAAFVARYQNDRVGFVENVLGVVPDAQGRGGIEIWQREELAAIDAGECRISIRSGHGVGKTAFLAWIAVHGICLLYPFRGVCTAGSASQLEDGLIPETKLWLGRLPSWLRALYDTTTDRIYRKSTAEFPEAADNAWISFRTARPEKPEAIQGIHADNVLLVVDEATGVDDKIFESGRGSMSTGNPDSSANPPIMVLTSNPTRRSGFFYKTQTEWSDRWHTRRVSCQESTRTDPAFVKEIANDYGEESPMYAIRVLGEFPPADEDSFIPYHLVNDAMNRDIEIDKDATIVWGLDVARQGADESALAKRQGNVIYEPIKTWRLDDSMELVGRIRAEYDTTPADSRPEAIYVDAIGFGGPVADRLRQLDVPAVDVNVQELPAMVDKYRLLRDEIWGNMLAWFRSRKCRVPQDGKLLGDLTAPKMLIPKDKIICEPKIAVKKRLGRSPDRADALGLTFAYDGAVASGGQDSAVGDINDLIDDGWARVA